MSNRWHLTLLALILVFSAASLFMPRLRNAAIQRCPPHSIEVGRNMANEPSCLPKSFNRVGVLITR